VFTILTACEGIISTAEAAETAEEKSPGILGDPGELCG